MSDPCSSVSHVTSRSYEDIFRVPCTLSRPTDFNPRMKVCGFYFGFFLKNHSIVITVSLGTGEEKFLHSDIWPGVKVQGYSNHLSIGLFSLFSFSLVSAASTARTRHADHVTSWHFSCHNPFSDSVRGTSMVGNVFGCWSLASWIASASCQTTRTMTRPSPTYSTLYWWWLFSSHQNQL